MAKKEMEYTTSAIATNFSNFSALHNRTKLIETILNLEADPNSQKALAKQILEQGTLGLNAVICRVLL